MDPLLIPINFIYIFHYYLLRLNEENHKLDRDLETQSININNRFWHFFVFSLFSDLFGVKCNYWLEFELQHSSFNGMHGNYWFK